MGRCVGAEGERPGGIIRNPPAKRTRSSKLGRSIPGDRTGGAQAGADPPSLPHPIAEPGPSQQRKGNRCTKNAPASTKVAASSRSAGRRSPLSARPNLLPMFAICVERETDLRARAGAAVVLSAMVGACRWWWSGGGGRWNSGIRSAVGVMRRDQRAFPVSYLLDVTSSTARSSTSRAGQVGSRG